VQYAISLSYFRVKALMFYFLHFQPRGTHVTVFSGHDVNLLGLLFALKAEQVFDVLSSNRRAFWPDYGLIFSFTRLFYLQSTNTAHKALL
jgi:hypothetical protein